MTKGRIPVGAEFSHCQHPCSPTEPHSTAARRVPPLSLSNTPRPRPGAAHELDSRVQRRGLALDTASTRRRFPAPGQNTSSSVTSPQSVRLDGEVTGARQHGTRKRARTMPAECAPLSMWDSDSLCTGWVDQREAIEAMNPRLGTNIYVFYIPQDSYIIHIPCLARTHLIQVGRIAGVVWISFSASG